MREFISLCIEAVRMEYISGVRNIIKEWILLTRDRKIMNTAHPNIFHKTYFYGRCSDEINWLHFDDRKMTKIIRTDPMPQGHATDSITLSKVI